MAKRPGGPMASRPLHFVWIVDSSGSMSEAGKMQALNNSVKDSLPHMKSVAHSNHYANVLVRCVRFSHGAEWHEKEPVPLDRFVWRDLAADPLEQTTMDTDIIFLMDTSGSMGGEIRALKRSCIEFANTIIKQEKGANVRLGLIGFAIGGHSIKGSVKEYTVQDLSRYTIGVWPLTTPDEFQNNIQSLKLRRFGGRGCYLANEDTVDIFPHVVKAFGSSKDNARILVIVSDEIGDTAGLPAIVSQLSQAGITTHVLGVPGENGAHELLAGQTGGAFWNILDSKGEMDFSGLLETVASTIAREVTKKLRDGRESHGTDMGAALKLVADVLKVPPMERRALPPVLVLISDGQPTDDFRAGLDRLMASPWGEKAVRVAIAIGRDANTEVLQDFIGRPDLQPFRARNPEALAAQIRWTSTAVLKLASTPVSKMGAQGTRPPIPQMVSFAADEEVPDIWWDE